MADITDTQLHQITGPKPAVQTQVKQRQYANAVGQLEPDSDGPDFPELEGGLLADEFPLFQGALVERSTLVSMMNSLKIKGVQPWLFYRQFERFS